VVKDADDSATSVFTRNTNVDFGLAQLGVIGTTCRGYLVWAKIQHELVLEAKVIYILIHNLLSLVLSQNVALSHIIFGLGPKFQQKLVKNCNRNINVSITNLIVRLHCLLCELRVLILKHRVDFAVILKK
jgi:hypothetical protein